MLKGGHQIACRRNDESVNIAHYIPSFKASPQKSCYKCACKNGFVACERVERPIGCRTNGPVGDDDLLGELPDVVTLKASRLNPNQMLSRPGAHVLSKLNRTQSGPSLKIRKTHFQLEDKSDSSNSSSDSQHLKIAAQALGLDLEQFRARRENLLARIARANASGRPKITSNASTDRNSETLQTGPLSDTLDQNPIGVYHETINVTIYKIKNEPSPRTREQQSRIGSTRVPGQTTSKQEVIDGTEAKTTQANTAS